MATFERNQNIDIARGFAMLLVVLGHTMTGTTVHYEESSLFCFIWTLQMPLFFLVSGYVTKFSSIIQTFPQLIYFIRKRFIAYIIPFVAWTIIHSICTSHNFPSFYFIFHNIDSGLWFLFVIFIINIHFGIAGYFSNILRINRVLSRSLLFFLSLTIWLLIALMYGTHFLGAKYILYYSILFMIGYLYSNYEGSISFKLNELTVFICFITFFVSLYKFDVFLFPDSIPWIILRLGISLSGCIVIFSALRNITNINIKRILKWFGINSLGIYVIHGLFLCTFISNTFPKLQSLYGFFSVSINFGVTLLLSFIVITFLNHNTFTKLILLGKNK